MKANFSALFKAPLEKYKYFFIYGNDLAVFDRMIFFIQAHFSSALHIKTEKEVMTESYAQGSLFDEPNQNVLTLVMNVTDKILGHLDKLGEGKYIFTSEKARAQSKLVTHFSAAPDALALGGYASPLIPSEFAFLTRELTLAPTFKEQLFKAYENDYRGLLSAIEKVKLYGEVPETAYADFLESYGVEDDLRDLIGAFLLKNQQKTVALLGTVPPADIILVLRTLARSFQTLYELMPYKQRPASIPWATLTPPVFFKEQPLYQSALSLWSLEDVHGFLETLLALEKKVKFERATLAQVGQGLMEALKLI